MRSSFFRSLRVSGSKVPPESASFTREIATSRSARSFSTTLMLLCGQECAFHEVDICPSMDWSVSLTVRLPSRRRFECELDGSSSHRGHVRLYRLPRWPNKTRDKKFATYRSSFTP